VAIIIIPEPLSDRENEIADAILRISPHIRMVAGRDGTCSGEYRITPLRKIGGTGGFTTLHKEFGVRLHVDPGTVYFSPRSANERYRIAAQVVPGERVLVMFSGIAPLPLMIGLHSAAAEVIGIEKNPAAHRFALKNLQVNRRVENVDLLCGDVEEIVPLLPGKFDRIAMPLPICADRFLGLAVDALGSGGRLHYYDFQDTGEFASAVEMVEQVCAMKKRKPISVQIHKCGHIAPGKYRICIDAEIE
jgi:tRNA (guanine37-N1)-methyltransferase